MKNNAYLHLFLIYFYLFVLSFSALVTFDKFDALENQVTDFQTKLERIK